MSDETYNGWSNRETWAVVLHIDNDQGWQQMVFEAIAAYTGGLIDEYAVGRIVADAFDEVLDMLVEAGEAERYASVVRDTGSAWRVVWDEVGDHYLNAHREALEEATS